MAIIKETQWSSFRYEYLGAWVSFKNSASSSVLRSPGFEQQW